MDRPAHYALSILFGATVTGIVALTTRAWPILLGIFVTYALSAAICSRYPRLVWGGSAPSVPSGVFGGGAVFGALLLGWAVGGRFQFGAAMLGLGLASFGLVTGYWLADTVDASRTAGA